MTEQIEGLDAEHLAVARHHAAVRERHLAKHVAFVGFMGAGKSTLGALTAQALSRPFFDVDEVIERNVGRTIQSFFSAGQEPEFRAIERNIIVGMLQGQPAVLALGGGAMANDETRAALLSLAWVVHLAVPWPDVRRALPELVPTRPVLRGRTEQEIHAIYLRRQQIYRQAHVTITPTRDISTALDEVLSILGAVSARVGS